MANPINGGTHNRKETYGATIVPLIRKEFVVRKYFGRNYEGDALGGAVQIPVRDTEVAVNNVSVATGNPITNGATTYLPVLITKYKGVNEKINHYEASAVPDNLVAQRLESAGYSIGQLLETNAINELETNGTASTEKGDAYLAIKNDIQGLKNLGIKAKELIVFVNSDVEGFLIDDKRVKDGKIGGVEIEPCYNLTSNYIVLGKPWAEAIDAWREEPKLKK